MVRRPGGDQFRWFQLAIGHGGVGAVLDLGDPRPSAVRDFLDQGGGVVPNRLAAPIRLVDRRAGQGLTPLVVAPARPLLLAALVALLTLLGVEVGPGPP